MQNLPNDFHNQEIAASVIDFLLKIPLFDELDGKELKIVATYMNYLELRKGKALFKEGDSGNFVCFVISGDIEVLKATSTGKNVVIATLGKGRIIGEMAIIDNTPRSATVRARETSTLVILGKKNFDIILENYPTIGIKILKGIARLLSLNMRLTTSQLADYILKDATT